MKPGSVWPTVGFGMLLGVCAVIMMINLAHVGTEPVHVTGSPDAHAAMAAGRLAGHDGVTHEAPNPDVYAELVLWELFGPAAAEHAPEPHPATWRECADAAHAAAQYKPHLISHEYVMQLVYDLAVCDRMFPAETGQGGAGP